MPLTELSARISLKWNVKVNGFADLRSCDIFAVESNSKEIAAPPNAKMVVADDNLVYFKKVNKKR